MAVPGLGWWENLGLHNIFATRINSHGSLGVVKCASYCKLSDSWVHGMRLGDDYHYNAIGSNGIEPSDGYFIINHNWLSCGDWASSERSLGDDAGCSAVIGFYGDFAPVQNVTVSRNYLVGRIGDKSVPLADNRQPGYCLNPGFYPGKPYPQPVRMDIRDNIFGRGDSGKCGAFGPTNSLEAVGKPSNSDWQNNRFDDGEVIGRPTE